jgi:hypothetical protein
MIEALVWAVENQPASGFRVIEAGDIKRRSG